MAWRAGAVGVRVGGVMDLEGSTWYVGRFCDAVGRDELMVLGVRLVGVEGGDEGRIRACGSCVGGIEREE